MAKILIAYASMAGSTAEVAERIAQTISAGNAQVERQPIRAIKSLEGYSAVIVAAPMILGWHRDAQRFVKQFAAQLATMPVAYCITCYELTYTGEHIARGVPITLDPQLCENRKDPGKLSFKEKQTTLQAYTEGALKQAPDAQPVDIGIFKGAVDFGKLSVLPMLFVRLIIRAKPGDYRDWDAITAWAENVSRKLAA